MFNYLSAVLLWVLCAVFVLGVLSISFTEAIPRQEASPEKLARIVRMFWLSLVVFALLAACSYLIRRRFWFTRYQPQRLGFWILTLFFYISVLFVVSSGFAPFVAVGDRSGLHWTGCAIGIVFLVLGFPRLPKAAKPSGPNSTIAAAGPAKK